MAILKKCCFCCSLEVGTIFAAVAGALVALAGIILILTLGGTTINWNIILLSDILPKWAITVILIVNFAMTIIISSLLLAGTLMRNIFLMLPWVILGAMMPLGVLISTIFTAINFFNDHLTTQAIIVIVLGIVAIIVIIYMWLVVFSFFQIVKKEYDQRTKYQKAPFRRYY